MHTCIALQARLVSLAMCVACVAAQQWKRNTSRSYMNRIRYASCVVQSIYNIYTYIYMYNIYYKCANRFSPLLLNTLACDSKIQVVYAYATLGNAIEVFR